MLAVKGNVGWLPALSSNVTVNAEFPAPVGVPLIEPPELRDNPAGKEPTLTDQVSGAMQFDAVS